MAKYCWGDTAGKVFRNCVYTVIRCIRCFAVLLGLASVKHPRIDDISDLVSKCFRYKANHRTYCLAMAEVPGKNSSCQKNNILSEYVQSEEHVV